MPIPGQKSGWDVREAVSLEVKDFEVGQDGETFGWHLDQTTIAHPKYLELGFQADKCLGRHLFQSTNTEYNFTTDDWLLYRNT